MEKGVTPILLTPHVWKNQEQESVSEKSKIDFSLYSKQNGTQMNTDDTDSMWKNQEQEPG